MRLATLIAVGGVALLGCKDDPKPTTTASSASAASASASGPAASASAPAPSAAPSASAAAPAHDCPKGTTGDGSYTKPCDAKGATRMMEVAWTGKTDDKGPHFRVTNKATLTILYGKIAVYFYDKAGKQLDTKDASGKAAPYHTCAGVNLFSGVMKASEKAVLTFSCVTPKDVPEGTAAIEAEMQMVGFSDATEKKVEYYWRNNDLTPDTRKKGAK